MKHITTVTLNKNKVKLGKKKSGNDNLNKLEKKEIRINKIILGVTTALWYDMIDGIWM